MDGLRASFMSGFHTACVVAAGVCALGAVGATALPGHARRASDAEAAEATDATAVPEAAAA